MDETTALRTMAERLAAAFAGPPGTPGPRLRLGLDRPTPGPTTLPAIVLPPDAESMPGGGSGWTGGRAEHAMVIRSAMDVSGVASFLASQLEQAGWARRDA